MHHFFETNREDVASRLEDPTPFRAALDFFDHWTGSGGNLHEGQITSYDLAAVMGGTRRHMHFSYCVEPLLSLDENVNGEGADGQFVPELLCRYPKIDYPVMTENLKRYHDALCMVLLKEQAEDATQLWVDSLYEINEKPRGYMPDVIDAGCLRRILGTITKRIPLDLDMNTPHEPYLASGVSSVLWMHTEIHERGDNIDVWHHGIHPEDSYTIHGNYFHQRTRCIAEQIFTNTQLGMNLHVPAEELYVENDDESLSVYWQHVYAIRSAIMELKLLEQSNIRYGVVWDQENFRSKTSRDLSISHQLTDHKSLILPVVT